jgi:hypothetical protein
VREGPVIGDNSLKLPLIYFKRDRSAIFSAHVPHYGRAALLPAGMC